MTDNPEPYTGETVEFPVIKVVPWYKSVTVWTCTLNAVLLLLGFFTEHTFFIFTSFLVCFFVFQLALVVDG